MSATNWKQKLPFLSVAPTVVKIGDNEYNFYPTSLGLAFKLKGIAKPLAAALQTLFGGENNDIGSLQSQFANDKGSFDSQMKVEAITPELAALRVKQKQEALGTLIDGITSEESLKLVAELIMDSMRDTFPKGDRPPPTEFINETPLPALGSMLGGVFKANKGVFGPLGEAMGKAIHALMKRVEEEVSRKVEAKTSPTPSSIPTPNG